MKIHILYCCLFFGKLFSQDPGMKIDDFKKKFPGIVPSKTYFNEDVVRQEKIGDFDGTWYFNFDLDTLRDLFFSSNLGAAPEQKFANSFIQLKKSMSLKFQNPGIDLIIDSSLSADRAKKYRRDTVMVCRWQMRECEVEMGLFHEGNKGLKQSAMDMVNQTNAMAPINNYMFRITCFPKQNLASTANWKFYPGMTALHLLSVKPDMFPEGLGVSGQWQKDETKFKLKGKNTWTFKNNILNTSVWDFYAKDTKEKSFNECLKCTKALIAECTKKYGAPSTQTASKKFNEVGKETYGGTVLKAEWHLQKINIVVAHQITGAKGVKFMTVKLEKTRTGE